MRLVKCDTAAKWLTHLTCTCKQCDICNKHCRSDDNECKMCCYLQQSMEALRDAYSKTIEEKDRAIRMLGKLG